MGFVELGIMLILIVGLVSPLLITPALIFDRMAWIFLGFGFASWLAFVMLLGTPGSTFLAAKWGKKTILFNPRSDRFADFSMGKRVGGLLHVKGKGVYNVSQDDVYIESSSKVPIATVYDTFALSVGGDDIELKEALNKGGYSNYRDMLVAWEHYERQLDRWVKTPEDKRPTAPTPPTAVIRGQSVNLSDIIQYFGANERSDVIEAQIMRATAAEKDKTPLQSDAFKYVTIIAVLLIVGALAYAIIQMNSGSGDTAQISQLTDFLKSQAKVISTTTTAPPSGTELV